MITENTLYIIIPIIIFIKIKSKLRMPVVTIIIWHYTGNSRYETEIKHIRNKLNKLLWFEEVMTICLETPKEPTAKLLEIRLFRQKITSQKPNLENRKSKKNNKNINYQNSA